MKLFAAGLSHKTAPVDLREQLAVKQSEIVDLAFVLKCFGHLDEIVLLSTCNRVEIYGTTRQATGHIKSLLQLLCAEPRRTGRLHLRPRGCRCRASSASCRAGFGLAGARGN